MADKKTFGYWSSLYTSNYGCVIYNSSKGLVFVSVVSESSSSEKGMKIYDNIPNLQEVGEVTNFIATWDCRMAKKSIVLRSGMTIITSGMTFRIGNPKRKPVPTGPWDQDLLDEYIINKLSLI